MIIIKYHASPAATNIRVVGFCAEVSFFRSVKPRITASSRSAAKRLRSECQSMFCLAETDCESRIDSDRLPKGLDVLHSVVGVPHSAEKADFKVPENKNCGQSLVVAFGEFRNPTGFGAVDCQVDKGMDLTMPTTSYN